MLQQNAIVRMVALATLLVISLMTVAVAGDVSDCNQSSNPDLRIRGCTGFIQSGAKGENLAIALTNRGIAYDAKNDTARAIIDFGRAIQVRPDYSTAFYNRGIAYSELGELDLAIVDFNETIRLDPNDPDAYDARGFTYYDLRDFESAISDFNKAIELDPDFGKAYYHRGLAYGAIGELDDGLADFNKSLELGCLRQGWCPPR